MGTGYCGDNRKLGEVSYGRETWGSVSFSEHRIVGQQGERYPENKAQGAEFFGEIWIFLLHPFVDQPGLGLGLVHGSQPSKQLRLVSQIGNSLFKYPIVSSFCI